MKEKMQLAYEYTPGSWNVHENGRPGATRESPSIAAGAPSPTSTSSQCSGARAPRAAVDVHVTVAPTGTLSCAGTKRVSSTDTSNESPA